jgi:subfamily B ATP-binding cassette protein MsbA
MTPPSDRRGLYLRLLGHVRPYWRRFALGLLATLLLALTEPLLPALFKHIIEAIQRRDSDLRWLLPLGLTGLYLLRGGASFVSSIAMAWVAERLVLDLREQMFTKLLRLPVSYYDAATTGALISRLNYNVAQVTNAATNVLVTLVRDTFITLGLLAFMFYTAWALTLLSLLAAPVVLLIVKLLARRMRGLSHQMQDHMGGMTHVIEEAVTGHKVVRAFGGADYEQKRFAATAGGVRGAQMRMVAATSINTPLVQMVVSLALGGVIYASFLDLFGNTMSAGDFVAFILAMGLLFPPIKRLTGVDISLQKSLAAAESTFSLLDEAEESDHGTQTLERASGRLRFEAVSFHYERGAQPALDSITLDIAPGETVALVGPSGSGKTTLAHLLPRFYTPGTGRILLDGVDIAVLRLTNLRQHIAWVGQDVVLFNGSVRDNIAYGAQRGAGDAAIRDAARAAHALEFIEALPQGLDTEIGERGVRLSGGQRQRLAIARAFLKNAPVLVLDEATSSLDNESERQVQAALEELRRGRTTLIIAHRLSTIEKADRIVVMQQGRIAESGTHDGLLAQGGLYARLYRAHAAQAEFRDQAHLLD